MMQTLKMSTVLPPAVAYRTRTAAAAPCVARMGLSSGSRRVSAPMPARRASVARPAARGMTTVRASELTYEIAPEGSRDYAPILGILGLAAYHYGRVNLNAPLVLKTLAWYQLFICGIALLFRRAELDNLASVVSPGVLAVAAVNIAQVTYMDAAVALFGYYICERLEGPFWLWVATLVGAIYAGYPSQWFVGATALQAATRLVRGGQNNKVPVLTIPVILASAWAIWKEHSPVFTVALMIASVVASGLKYAETVSDSS